MGLVIASMFIAITPISTQATDYNPDLVITSVGVIHGPSWQHHLITPWIKNQGNEPAGMFHTKLAFETHSRSGFGSLTILKTWQTNSLPINWVIFLPTYDHLWIFDPDEVTGRYIVTVDYLNEVDEGTSGGENNNVFYTPWWPWEP